MRAVRVCTHLMSVFACVWYTRACARVSDRSGACPVRVELRQQRVRMSAELDFRMVRVCCIALELDTPPVTPARLGDGLPDGNMTKRTSADG